MLSTPPSNIPSLNNANTTVEVGVKSIKYDNNGYETEYYDNQGNLTRSIYNVTLIQALTKGLYYHKLWEENKLTREQKESSYIRRIMNLRLLPPTLIEDILYGKQDPNLMISDLYKLVKV